MQENFTPEKLLLFIYGECDTQTSIEVIEKVLGNNDINELYRQLLDAKVMLDSIHYQPQKDTLDRIFEYQEEY